MTDLTRALLLFATVLAIAALAGPVEWIAHHPAVVAWAALVAVLAATAAAIYDTARPR